MSGTCKIFLKDGSVWDSTDSETSFLCRRLQLCQSCQHIMTSPENIKSLLATVRGMPGPGIPICSEAKGPTSRGPVCSARTIAIAAVAAHNEKAQSSPRVEVVGRPMKPPVLIDPTRAAFKFNVSKGEDSGDKPWHDIKHLSLRYGNEPVPLVEFDISALPGVFIWF